MPTKPKKNESKQDYLSRCTLDVMENEGKSRDKAYAQCNALWDDSKGQRQTLTLSAPIELKANEEEDAPGSFLITAYTGKVIQTWWRKIVFDIKGMTAKAKIPILREHARDRVVGFSDKAWNDKNNFYVSGLFSGSTQDAGEVRDLGKEGFPWQASVGIWPLKVKVLDSDKEKETVNGREIEGPAEIWQESLVGEVSFVSLGADDDTAAIVLSDQGEERKAPVEIIYSTKFSEEEDEVMDEITLAMLEENAPDLLEQIRESARKEGADAERLRVVEILNADAAHDAALSAIEDGMAVEAAYKLFFKAEKEKRAAGLEQLKNEATPPQGQDNEQHNEDLTGSAEDRLMEIAKALQDEKNFSWKDAWHRARKENPELYEKYTKRQ